MNTCTNKQDWYFPVRMGDNLVVVKEVRDCERTYGSQLVANMTKAQAAAFLLQLLEQIELDADDALRAQSLISKAHETAYLRSLAKVIMENERA